MSIGGGSGGTFGGQLSQPTAKYLAVVAFGFGGHLYPYSLQTATEAETKQLMSSKILILHTQQLCIISMCPNTQGGLKMNFLGIPGLKYDLARNASNFFYSKPLT